ncbi:helix-turn-helix domain-containing protein [Halomonas sp.]|uniref:helix-turn-helix domain-containing protein n=1 Tax=Halomonas sp. TaxID=1486246 RepID=UPI003D0AF339
MEPLLISAGQAARLLSVSRRTVYRLMDDGQVPVVTVGGRRMIHRARLVAQIDADAGQADTAGASGVSQGGMTCHTEGKARRTGGSVSHHRAAASRLDALLGP